MKIYKKRKTYILFFAIVLIISGGCAFQQKAIHDYSKNTEEVSGYYSEATLRTYSIINANQPEFYESEKKRTDAFEEYSDLDYLGRCGVAYANICKELMPKKERESIGMIKPTGWQIAKYNDIEGNYLYNRCHLIAYMLAGENANEKNLITGTRYFNVSGMLPFESMVYDYVKDTGNHVLYRVEPVFEGNDLVAKGVKMEAYSVEDAGKGICFNVFVYNVQPGISIDYATGKSVADKNVIINDSDLEIKSSLKITYVVNKNTGKFHKTDCKAAKEMKKQNKKEVYISREELIKKGYDPCNLCNP